MGFSFNNQIRADPYLATTVGTMQNLLYSDELINNHWRQPGDKAKYPKYSTIGSLAKSNFQWSDANYVNASTFRMNTLSIEWKLPPRWLSKVAVKNAAFSLQTQNLFTISPFKGLNPDAQSLNVMPVARTIVTNLSFTF
jgi:hypothetical protein